MIRGINQVLLEVEDQDRALSFWTEAMGFELVKDAPYDDGARWIEVRPRSRGDGRTEPAPWVTPHRSRGDPDVKPLLLLRRPAPHLRATDRARGRVRPAAR